PCRTCHALHVPPPTEEYRNPYSYIEPPATDSSTHSSIERTSSRRTFIISPCSSSTMNESRTSSASFVSRTIPTNSPSESTTFRPVNICATVPERLHRSSNPLTYRRPSRIRPPDPSPSTRTFVSSPET